jgi:hypothetical protein
MNRLVLGEVLFLYLVAIEGAVSAALIREDDDIQDKFIMYLELAFVLIIASRKLHPYFQAHSIRILTKEPLKKAL